MFQALAVLVLCASVVIAQPPRPPGGGGQQRDLTCAGNNLTRCPMQEPFQPVIVTASSNYRLIQTTSCPPYPQNWTVMQEACINDRTIEIPLTPRFATTPVPIVTALSDFDGITYLEATPTPVLGSIGLFDNGVYIYGSSSPCGFGSACPTTDANAPSIWVDAVGSEGDTIDYCGGHPTPIDLEYHVHSGATFTASNAGREHCGLPIDTAGQHSTRLGWMYDGFGIYGRYSLNGEVPTDLDRCSGHTHEIDGVMTYHYHIPDQFPWIIGCFKGCPRVENNQGQLSFANGNDYGCPEGLAEDPGFVPPVGDNGANKAQAMIGTLVLLIFIAVIA